MNVELYHELEDCICCCQRLSSTLEQDLVTASKYVTGEIFSVYREHTYDTIKALQTMKKQMLVLQGEQLL